ncbi:MAG: toll/interleukin-1 receptor domain-containing protein [Pseudonocardiales bacterium]|nr:toll/interleukin-1 receptor domain-containing protein [Pseudonocardiales bacterium]
MLFINHASVDKPLADLLRDTLILGGVPENIIFYSSDRATGIPTGEDVREQLRKVLGERGLVIELISSAFLRRPICLMELDGAWALNKSTYPIVIPPLDHRKAINQLGEVRTGILGSESDIDEVFDELNISTFAKRWLRSKSSIVEPCSSWFQSAASG